MQAAKDWRTYFTLLRTLARRATAAMPEPNRLLARDAVTPLRHSARVSRERHRRRPSCLEGVFLT